MAWGESSLFANHEYRADENKAIKKAESENVYIGNDIDLSNYEQVYPASEPARPVPPVPQHGNARDSMMYSSMPGIASTSDSLVRQFYSAGLPQFRIILPSKK